jgi:hypothetical protein
MMSLHHQILVLLVGKEKVDVYNCSEENPMVHFMK